MKTKTIYLLAALTLLGGLSTALAQPAVRYPYVDTGDAENGPVIVSRDARGGASASVFHPDWITTPDHTDTSAENTIPAKLQIANADLSEEGVVWNEIECPEGWRTPTAMELVLIRAMGGAPEDTYCVDREQPGYNPPATDTPLYGVAGYTPLKASAYWSASRVSRSRSSVTTVSLVTGMTGGGSAAGPDVNFVRCVRDVK